MLTAPDDEEHGYKIHGGFAMEMAKIKVTEVQTLVPEAREDYRYVEHGRICIPRIFLILFKLAGASTALTVPVCN